MLRCMDSNYQGPLDDFDIITSKGNNINIITFEGNNIKIIITSFKIQVLSFKIGRASTANIFVGVTSKLQHFLFTVQDTKFHSTVISDCFFYFKRYKH